MLIESGFNESFGKPHDGLGFTPQLMEHLHGSTAIGGIALYHAKSFPKEYRGSAFGGNVMTSRISRNSIQQRGGSLVAREEPDFLISGDPWFRPVDLQVGPDGAMYVADFYNKIIGHYEVPLDHPGRDRHRGRIWRIVYKVKRFETEPHSSASLQLATSLDDALAALRSDNLSKRMLATDEIVDKHVKESSLDRLHQSLLSASSSNEKVHILWALARLDELKAEELETCLSDTDARVRGHCYQVLATFPERTLQTDEWIKSGFQDPNPRIRRYAAGAAAKLCSKELITPILSCLIDSRGDPHLHYALRIALRNHLKDESWFKALTPQFSSQQRAEVIDICLALKTNYAGQFIAANLDLVRDSNPKKLSECLTFASRFASLENLHEIIDLSRDSFESDLPKQEELLRSVSSGLSQRGLEPTAALKQWTEALARNYLNIGPAENSIILDQASIPWSHVAAGEASKPSNTWQLSNRRNSADGEQSSLLHSSFLAGEQKVGTYRSGTFTLSMQFSFYVAGHDGFPDKPLQGNNFVGLCDATTHRELVSWPAPRNDMAKRVEWLDTQHEGRRVYVELVDGDSANAYAWLAVGRFSEEGLNPSNSATRYLRAARLVRDLKIRNLTPVMLLLMSNPAETNEHSSQFAKAYAAIHSGPCATALAEAISFPSTDAELRSVLINLLENRESAADSVRKAMSSVMRVATAAEQRNLALELSRNHTGITVLLELVEAGSASPCLLIDPVVAARLETLGNEREIALASYLTTGLTSDDQDVRAAIQRRRQAYMTDAGEVSRGAIVFSKNCANCHRVEGKGSEVGPNLDGIGNRGLDRLLEDVLLPNRNIDNAFRSTTAITEDGNVLSGLVKRLVGKQLLLVDQTGREHTVATDAIASKKTVRLSPMPSNFQGLLTEDQLRDLLAYLLSLTN
ncbi:MAG: c-type cytochrome [Planctomycetota bacterium]|nr:c-type cytochrome [Planctomycetota bacterium]